jgi:hypothetical protein
MKRHGINPGPACPLFSAFVEDFASLETLTLPSQNTVLFLGADASSVPSDAIYRVAERLLDAGVIWICVWGPDCQRVHDLFDEAYVGDGIVERDFCLMSTWHDDESLEQALWFFVQLAFPLDHEIPTTSYVAVTVGRHDWAISIEKALSDLVSFSRRSDAEAD